MNFIRDAAGNIFPLSKPPPPEMMISYYNEEGTFLIFEFGAILIDRRR